MHDRSRANSLVYALKRILYFHITVANFKVFVYEIYRVYSFDSQLFMVYSSCVCPI